MTAEVASVVSSVITSTDITFYLSIAAALISLATFTVGYSQMRIASAKTKFDLYNKRFSVYLAALEFYQYMHSDVQEELKSKSNKLTHAYRESKFLFDAEDGVYETLGRIQKAGVPVRVYSEFKKSGTVDGDRSKKLFDKSQAALLEMEKDIYILEDQLKNYLSFHNVRGWTLF
ncbi:hypothetical protein [Pseudomonas laurylsulfatiphila]|uniref:hypothetical protein n=1 Tax=Pseudomonas laurylsulfatiphila TaxID=2011015 RepID=UPI003D1DFA60